MSWFAVALLGGIVGLDSTSFPQVMISRPLVAGALTGALFGRPGEGVMVGLLMELFSLIVLPIGAARYPESGTATVAATSAYLAVTPAAVAGGVLVLALLFGLIWERLAGLTVVLQRRNNGQLLTRTGPVTAEQLERRHLSAMTLDFVRGGVVAASGGLIGHGLIRLIAPTWGLDASIEYGLLAVLAAAMVGTAVPLFGGWRARKLTLAAGLAVGTIAAVLVS